ncbi:hypothetical protein [Polaromonas sp. JS666]|uniref:hypothetical protein n=1 Tax=Polaromonas sp. (strain JS666 / ATCC BAA-500) TaxID=296591 RepID=UPI0000463F6A|nr:hypothetical protein [Polaromonas sp. JS666]
MKTAVILQLAELLRPMDKTDRKMAKDILGDLVDNPEEAALMASKFEHMFGERGARRTECGGIGTARIYQFRLLPENPFP